MFAYELFTFEVKCGHRGYLARIMKFKYCQFIKNTSTEVGYPIIFLRSRTSRTSSNTSEIFPFGN